MSVCERGAPEMKVDLNLKLENLIWDSKKTYLEEFIADKGATTAFMYGGCGPRNVAICPLETTSKPQKTHPTKPCPCRPKKKWLPALGKREQ